MSFDPQLHHRRSIRLKGYDYSLPGFYFVTIVTKNRASIFGQIMDGKFRLSRPGLIVRKCWLELPYHYPHIRLDEYCLMPDHFHGIIEIMDAEMGGGIINSDMGWGIIDPGTGGSSDSDQGHIMKRFVSRNVVDLNQQTRPSGNIDSRRSKINPPLSEIMRPSNHFPPGESITCAIATEYPCGNATITISSFAAIRNWNVSGNISAGIHCGIIMDLINPGTIKKTSHGCEVFC